MDLPYAYDEVWDAAVGVLQQAKWDVTKADRTTGGFESKVVMDLLT